MNQELKLLAKIREQDYLSDDLRSQIDALLQRPADQPWSLEDATEVAHESGFAGKSWHMSPEDLAHLLNVAAMRPPVAHATAGLSSAIMNLPAGDETREWANSREAYLYGHRDARHAAAELAARKAAPMSHPTARDVGRLGDMSPVEHLRVGLDDDNDVYVSVWGEDGGASVEFCTIGAGGGSSPRTREALIELMVAMEADNATRPDKDWWACRRGGATAPGSGEAN